MGNFDIKTTIQNMVSTQMEFGDYNKHQKNLAKNNQAIEKPGTANVLTLYRNLNGALVGTARKHYSNQGTYNGTIFYNDTGLSYSTGWQATSSNNTKINHITFYGFTITDKNQNGYVDENDTIKIPDENNTMTVGEFLNSQS